MLRRNLSRKGQLYSAFGARGLSITDSLTSWGTERLAKTKEKNFIEQLQSLSSGKPYSMADWKVSIEGQVSSWRSYIPGVSGSAEMEQLKSYKKIMDSMSDTELSKPENIKGPARERIARESGENIDDVARVIFSFRQSLVLREWLLLKKKNGEALPETEVELQQMQETDQRLKGIAQRILTSNKRIRSGRGRGLPF